MRPEQDAVKKGERVMKNRRYEKKRAMSVVLAAVLAAGLLAGCGGNKSETNKAGEQAKDAEYVTTYGEKCLIMSP